MKDREAEIREILSGPEYMDCPAGLGARIPIADCVARQTRGICLQGIPSGWIPEMCRDCAPGRAALKAFQKGGKETMGKKGSNPRPPAEAVKPDPPPAPVKAVVWGYPSVVVSFDGHEDLCRRLMDEAAKCGETVGQHLRWLAGVYVQGLDR